MAAILLVACLATWLTFSRLQDLQHADTLILAIVSLQRWTPFLWESDRFGMLVPLIAKPVHDPFSNLLLQTAVDVAAALLAPFLLARFLMRDSRWFSTGATANLLLLVTATAAARFDWLVAQPYAMSTSLGLASLLMLETDGRPRLFAAAVLMLLGHWVNVGIGIMLVPLVLLGGGRSRWRAALLIGASTLSVSLFARALPLPRTTTAVISISAWPHAWSLLLQTAAAATVPSR